jgi:chromosome condensin MukBEF MukE localization factor
MYFYVSPEIEENEIVSEQRSLYQELLAITPSARQLNLQAKVRFGVVVGSANPSR